MQIPESVARCDCGGSLTIIQFDRDGFDFRLYCDRDDTHKPAAAIDAVKRYMLGVPPESSGGEGSND